MEKDLPTEMNASENLLCSDPFSNSAKPTIDKAHNPTPFSTCLTHDRHLSTGIDECFDNMAIHFTILNHRLEGDSIDAMEVAYDVEHHDVTEHFGSVFYGMFHVLLDVLHTRVD